MSLRVKRSNLHGFYKIATSLTLLAMTTKNTQNLRVTAPYQGVATLTIFLI